MGPLLSGTGFYLKRESLYGSYKIKGIEIEHYDLFNCFNIDAVICNKRTLDTIHTHILCLNTRH